MQEMILKLKGIMSLNEKMFNIQVKKQIKLQYQLCLFGSVINTYSILDKKDYSELKNDSILELLKNIIDKEQNHILKELGFNDIQCVIKKHEETKNSLSVTSELIKDLICSRKEIDIYINKLNEINNSEEKDETYIEQLLAEINDKYRF